MFGRVTSDHAIAKATVCGVIMRGRGVAILLSFFITTVMVPFDSDTL